MVMICQHRLNCNKSTSLVGAIDNGEGYAYVGAEGKWEISIFLLILL